MTAAPALPPLPKPDIVDPLRFGPVYIISTVQSIQLAAYHAGRNAGLNEAAHSDEINQKSPARAVNAGSTVETVTGRDLYNSQRGYPMSPEWCTLSDEDQADWNRKAKEQS